MNHPGPISSTRFFALLTIALLGFVACGRPSPEAEQEATKTREEGQRPTLELHQLERPQVCKRELDSARADLRAHFISANGTDTILADSAQVRWSELEQLVAKAGNAGNLGVRFHYGAVQNGNRTDLIFAASVVRLERRMSNPSTLADSIYFTVRDTNAFVHLLRPDGTLHRLSTPDWTSGEWNTYCHRVKVKRTNEAGWDGITEGYDHASYLFKWADLQAIHAQNAPADRLIVYAIASPLIRHEGLKLEDDWFMDLAVVAADESHIFVDNSLPDPHSPYRNKAADLGNPCPPGCNLARFYRYGLLPRTGVKCN